MSNENDVCEFFVISKLSTLFPYITIANPQQSIGNLTAGESKTITYQITAAGDTPDGSTAFFDVNIVADYNRAAYGNFYINIGLKPLAIVKLAANEPSADSMMICLQNLEVGCEVLTEIPQNTSVYKSLFVLLGTFPDNHVLTQDEGQQLAAFLNNGGRVYMEGSDTWAVDDTTAVHPMFHITGLNDGLGDLSVINGMDNSIMDGLSFEFNGVNNYIDRIAADDSSILIFQNNDPVYGNGVSFANNTYKTVGLSFEFAGLIDSPDNTKDIVMARILEFFGIKIIWTDIKQHNNNEFNASVFPNPFNNRVNISVNLENSGNLNVVLYNSAGQKVADLYSGRAYQGNNKIVWNTAVHNLKQGVYFIKISTAGKTYTRKLVYSGR